MNGQLREAATQVLVQLKWFDFDSEDGQMVPEVSADKDDPLLEAVQGLQGFYPPYKTLPLPGQGYWRRLLTAIHSVSGEEASFSESNIERFFDRLEAFRMWLAECYDLKDPEVIVNEEGADSSQTPHWDQEARVLWWGTNTCKKFNQEAGNQELLLQSFEELDWPEHLDDPLPGLSKTHPKFHLFDAKQRLRDTVKRLNRNPYLQFTLDGTGAGICWKPRVKRP